jgi:4-amino-4-deoxy-L-arabinose transferase-like glycosyltransferase
MVLSNNLLQRLPRWLLWVLVPLYAIPGLLMRDPWRAIDANNFGVAATMAQGDLSDWLAPNIYGLLYAEEGPLTYWLAASIGKVWLLLGGRTDWLDEVMRLSCLIWLMAICWTVWSTAQRIAKRPEMQPLNPLSLPTIRSDYSYSIADCAVLCLLASLGLMVKSHQLVAEMPELLGVSIVALAAVRSINRPITAGWALGAGLCVIILARGWSHGIFIFGAMLLAALSSPMSRFGLGHRLVRATIVVVGVLGLWALAVWHLSASGPQYLKLWWAWNLNQFTDYNSPRPLFSTALQGLKTFAWFFWPAWPLTAWTLWSHRKNLSDGALKPPLAGFLGGLVGMLFYDATSEGNFFPLLGLLSVLAALGLGTLRRSVISLIDWFALFIFSITGAVVWLGWSAIMYGTPAGLVKNIRRLVPDFIPSVVAIELMLAMLVTLAWVLLLIWRVQKHPKAIWRSLALSCGGTTLVWLLMMTLWLPMINTNKSYATVAKQIQSQMKQHHPQQAQACLSTMGLGFPQRASLAYLGDLNFEYSRAAQIQKQKSGSDACPWTLSYISFPKNAAVKTPNAPAGDWILIWEGRRASDKQELFRLYARR